MTNSATQPNISSSASTIKKMNPRDILDQNANAIIEKLIERAIAGDLTALRLCVERIIPHTKPNNGINFEMPEGRIDSGENMLQIVNDTTKAVADGQLTIEEAEKFTGFLKRQRWLIGEAERQKKDEEWKKERGY
jgi:hypothetical protein